MTDRKPSALSHHLTGSPFVRFLMTSGAAALANIASRIALNWFMAFEWAVIGAFFVGLATAFVLARLFVFDRTGRSVQGEFVRFLLVNLVALVQVWLVSIALANWLFPAIGFTWNAELIAHVAGVLSPAFTSYYAHKMFTFRPANNRD